MPCLILGISHFIPNTSDNSPAITANIGLFSKIPPLPTVITTTYILKAYYSYFLILFNLQNALQKNK